MSADAVKLLKWTDGEVDFYKTLVYSISFAQVYTMFSIELVLLKKPTHSLDELVEKVDWESCARVLSADEKRKALAQGWG
jgi:hypothetical protein